MKSKADIITNALPIPTLDGAEHDITKWASKLGKNYTISWSTNLFMPDGGFQPLDTNLPGTGPDNVYTDVYDGPAVFYRIELEE
jgi:hypothetical protein